jgi:hypothetical protein
LFEIFDPSALEQISTHDFQTSMLAEMYRVLVPTLQVLCEGEVNAGFINTNTLASYLRNLENGFPTATEDFTKDVFGTNLTVTKPEFVFAAKLHLFLSNPSVFR